MKRRRSPWRMAVRFAAIPVWFPFVLIAWVGERAEEVFWLIEKRLPSPYRP